MHTLFPNKIVSALLIFLVIFNIMLWSAYSARGVELRKAEDTISNTEHSRNILSFQKLFVEKVLKSDGEVNYNTRRELEQAVGKTNDDVVISAWNSFIEAKNETDGQIKVKDLISVLANRAIY